MPGSFDSVASRIDAAARRRVQERMGERASLPPAALLQDAGIPGADWEAAATLLSGLGEVLGVDPNRLRAQDRLSEVLRVDSVELPGLGPDDWKRAGLTTHIVVFAYDIMHLVERFSDRRAWKKKWTSLPDPPRKEEDWVDLILEMRLGEFLAFFTPLAGSGARFHRPG